MQLTIQSKSVAMCLASQHGNFLVNHIFRLNPTSTRYSLYLQYKNDQVIDVSIPFSQLKLNSILTHEGNQKAAVQWFPNDWFTQEATSIVFLVCLSFIHADRPAIGQTPAVSQHLLRFLLPQNVYRTRRISLFYSLSHSQLSSESGIGVLAHQMLNDRYSIAGRVSACF